MVMKVTIGDSTFEYVQKFPSIVRKPQIQTQHIVYIR